MRSPVVRNDGHRVEGDERGNDRDLGSNGSEARVSHSKPTPG